MINKTWYVTKNINIGSLSDLDFGGGFYVKDLTSSSASNINLSNSAQLTGSDLATESWFDTYPSELSSNKEIVDLTSTGNVGLFDSSIIETLTLPYLAGPNPDNYPSININSNSVYFNNVAIPTNTQVLAPDQNFPKIKSTGYSPHNFIKIQKSSSLNIGSGNLWNTSIDSGQALTKISNKGYITIPKTNVESLHQPSGFRLEKISVDNFKVSPDPTAVKLNIISGTKQTDDYDPSYLRVSDLNEKLSNWAFDSPFTEVIHRDKYMQIWLDILNRDKMINEFNKLKVDNTNNLLKLINPILLKFSDDKEISIVLQKKDLIVAKTELDITDDIIKIVNAEIKELKIK